MNGDIKARLDKLVAQGKISEDERKELEEAIFSEEKTDEYKLSGDIHLIKVKSSLSCNLKINGDEKEKEIKIVEGNEFFKVLKKGDIAEIAPIYPMRHFGVFKIDSKNNFYPFLKRTFSSSKHLSVIIPQKSNIEIKIVSGNISIAGVKGNILAKTVSGDIKLDSVKGDAKLISLSGDIECKKVKGSLYAETKSGDIEIESGQLHGNLKTYSGNISMQKSTVLNLAIIVYSGDITGKSMNVNGSLSAKSIFGDMKLELIGNDYLIKSETSFGKIHLSLKGNSYHIVNESVFGNMDAGISNFKKERLSYGSKLEFGNGNIPINIKTKKGCISIKII